MWEDPGMDVLTSAIVGEPIPFTEAAAFFLGMKKHAWHAGAIGAGIGGAGLGALGYHKARDVGGRAALEREAQQELRLLHAAIDPETGRAGALHRLKERWVRHKLQSYSDAKKSPARAGVLWGIMGAGAGGLTAHKLKPSVVRFLASRGKG